MSVNHVGLFKICQFWWVWACTVNLTVTDHKTTQYLELEGAKNIEVLLLALNRTAPRILQGTWESCPNASWPLSGLMLWLCLCSSAQSHSGDEPFPNIRPKPPWHNLRPFPLVLSLVTSETCKCLTRWSRIWKADTGGSQGVWNCRKSNYRSQKTHS